MVSVEQLIGDLLLRHNCVIIPSFGGFVAKQASAVIDYKTGVMAPPRKSLLFNRQLINNDGLLIAELAVSNSIHYNEATEIVHSLVDNWNSQLKKGERVSIDKVGFLFFDQEKNICFEQDRFFNLLLESYGLGKVHFLTDSDVQFAQKTTIERAIENSEANNGIQPAIVFNTEKIIQESVQPKTKIIEHPALKAKTKVWKYIAAACFLPIAFYSFWLPVKTDVLESGMISINDFNPFYKNASAKYKKSKLVINNHHEDFKTLEESVASLPSDVTVFSYEFDEDVYIPIRISEGNTQNVEPTIESAPEKTSANFEYIVGCFSDETNASNLVTSLKGNGINAYILDVQNGLTRISAGSASTDSELKSIIQKVNSLGLNGWTLKK